jgi:hypothetical protein
MCDGSVVNAYAFPPFCLVEPLLRFIVASQAVVTVVVPKFFPVPFWWPVIPHRLEQLHPRCSSTRGGGVARPFQARF